MAKTEISIEFDAGDKVYHITQFKNKVYVISSEIAEVSVSKNKKSASISYLTTFGIVFQGDSLGKRFFASPGEAEETAKKLVDELNALNATLSNGSSTSYGGVIG